MDKPENTKPYSETVQRVQAHQSEIITPPSAVSLIGRPPTAI